MSGGGGSARLESLRSGVQVDELGIGDQVWKIHRMRQQQQGRRRNQHRACLRDDGADRASVAWVMIGIMVGGRLPGGFISGLRRGEGVVGNVRRRRLRGGLMEMSERQRKLNGQRQQCQPRSMFDVRPEPVHADRRPTSVGRGIPARQCYIITSGICGRVNGGPCTARRNPEACVIYATHCKGRLELERSVRRPPTGDRLHRDRHGPGGYQGAPRCMSCLRETRNAHRGMGRACRSVPQMATRRRGCVGIPEPSRSTLAISVPRAARWRRTRRAAARGRSGRRTSAVRRRP